MLGICSSQVSKNTHAWIRISTVSVKPSRKKQTKTKTNKTIKKNPKTQTKKKTKPNEKKTKKQKTTEQGNEAESVFL